MAVGCYSYIIPVYVGEISSNELRGFMLSIFPVALNSGVLFVFAVGHFTDLFVLNVSCASVTILYTFGFLLLPESPAIHISKNRVNAAKRSLKLLRGKFYNPDQEIQRLQKENIEAMEHKRSFINVLQKKSTKKAFIIILIQFTLFPLTGINVISFYLTTIFVDAGISLEPGVASIVIACVQLSSSLIVLLVVDRFGRKMLLCLSNSFMSIGMIGLAIYFTFNDIVADVNGFEWLAIVSLATFVIAFTMGMGSVSYILLGELFVQEAKGFVAPLGQFMNFLLTFVTGLAFPYVVAVIGTESIFFIFSGFCAFALIFTIFFIPETKGKSMAEIQNILS